MKYKFHEQPEHPDFGEWSVSDHNDSKVYTKEICWICKNTGREFNKFRVNDETFCEPVLFYNNRYFGYLDQLFYMAFDLDDWDMCWDFDN